MGRRFTRGAPIRSVLTLAAGAVLVSWTLSASGQGYPPPAHPPQAYPPQAHPPQHYPPYPQGQQAAPPRPAPSGPPTVVYGWDPDVPPPRGYWLDSEPNCSFIGMGIGLFASGWATAAFVGAIATDIENSEDEVVDLGGGVVRRVDDSTDGVLARDWMPMFVPVVGPFWAIATLDPDPSGIGLLLTNGIFQAAGVASLIGGILDRQYKIVREPRAAGLDVAPMVGAGQTGLQLTGSF